MAGVSKVQPTGQIQPAFIDNVLLRCSQAHFFTCCLCYSHMTVARLSSCNRDHVLAKSEVFTIWSFTESLLMPVLKDQGKVSLISRTQGHYRPHFFPTPVHDLK